MIITEKAFLDIKQHAESGYPAEVVGILAGHQPEQEISIIVPLTNLKNDTHNRYLVDGKEQWQVEQRLEDAGFDVLGYYHSHPDHGERKGKRA